MPRSTRRSVDDRLRVPPRTRAACPAGHEPRIRRSPRALSGQVFAMPPVPRGSPAGPPARIATGDIACPRAVRRSRALADAGAARRSGGRGLHTGANIPACNARTQTALHGPLGVHPAPGIAQRPGFLSSRQHARLRVSDEYLSISLNHESRVISSRTPCYGQVSWLPGAGDLSPTARTRRGSVIGRAARSLRAATPCAVPYLLPP